MHTCQYNVHLCLFCIVYHRVLNLQGVQITWNGDMSYRVEPQDTATYTCARWISAEMDSSKSMSVQVTVYGLERSPTTS